MVSEETLRVGGVSHGPAEEGGESSCGVIDPHRIEGDTRRVDG
jgi:hypothetical protein